MWNIHWQCCFQSLNGTVYAVNIYEQDYVGNIVQLTGASEPFTTNENEADDIFSPIRQQTGTLRFIDDNTILSAIIPTNNTDKLVRLVTGYYNNGTFTQDSGNSSVKWQGFLQTQLFTQDMFRMNGLELPVVDILGVLGCIKVNTDWATTKVKFVDYILALFDAIGADLVSSVVFLSDISNPLDFFNAKIDADVFIHVTDSVDGVIYESDGYDSVFSAMLSLFGLTARMEGTTLYLAQYDNPTLSVGHIYAVADLRTISSGGTVTPAIQSLDTQALFDVVNLKGTNNRISYITGINKAVVELNVSNDNEKELMEMPLMSENNSQTVKTVGLTNGTLYAQGIPSNGLIYDPDLGTNAYTRNGNVLDYEIFNFLKYDLQFNGNNEWYYRNGALTTFGTYYYHTIITDTVANIASHINKTVYTGAQPARYFYTSAGGYVNLLNGIMLQMKHVMESDTLVQNEIYTIVTRKSYTFTRGVIALDMNCLMFLDNGYNANTIRKATGNDPKTLWVCIKVGNQYWNGSSWQNSRIIIKLYFNESGALVTDNSSWQQQYNTNIEGYWMPIPLGTTMSGTVEIQFFDQYGDPSGGPIWAAAFMSGLTLRYAECDEVAARHRSSNIYNLLADNSFSEEKNITLKVGTINNNVQSPIFVLLGNDYMQKIYFRVTAQGATSQYRPEFHLLARLWNNRSSIRQTLKLIIQKGIEAMHSVYTYSGRTFLAIRSKTNWSDESQEIKLIEI